MKNLNNYKINRAAVFSDETAFFREPLFPTSNDEIKLRLRTLKDGVDIAEIVGLEGTIKMIKEKTEGGFDYYFGIIPAGAENISYCFRIQKKNEKVFYTKAGISDYHVEHMDFLIIKDFTPPQWSHGAVMYQIFVDRFCNGDLKNDVKDSEYIYLEKPVKSIKNWYQPPDFDDVRNFYGGDLAGVIKKLDYLKELGVEALYLSPVFVSPSNHKYDIQDYEHIDPHFGKIVKDEGNVLEAKAKDNENASLYVNRTTDIDNLKASDEVFIHLVEKCHSLGIKVIIDGVFNHCGAFNKWLDRENIYGRTGNYDGGAFFNKNSKYHNYFVWNEDGSYQGWWNYPNHPKLYFENSKDLLNKIMKVGKQWVSAPFNADGWRMDVAADLGLSKKYNHYFWKELRKNVKGANPESIILAEHYGDPMPWLKGDEWDTVMNYDAFMEPLSYFLTGMEKHSDYFNEGLLNNGQAFVDSMISNMARLPIQSLMTSMNQLSNHDHSRFLSRTNHACGRVKDLGTKAAEENVEMAVMREAVMVQMTWIGAPTVYYGDEAGVCGFTDPDNRRTYPWGQENIGLIQYHQQLIALRKRNPILKFGSTLFLYSDYGIIAYGRFGDKDKIVVLINNNDEERTVKVPVWQIGLGDEDMMERIFTTHKDGFGFSGKRYKIQNGILKIVMKRKSGVILSNGH